MFALRARIGVVALGMAVVGCSSSTTTVRPDAGNAGGADAATEAASEGGGCNGTMQSGTVLCDNVLFDLCLRRIQCAPSVTCADCGTCSSARPACSQCTNSCTETSCKQWMATDPKGYDCTLPKFANKQVCADAATTCEQDLQLIACSDSQAGTWNWPASCVAFWSQFQ